MLPRRCATRFLAHRECQHLFIIWPSAHTSPPPLAGTPKEAIKDTTPAAVTAEDDAEVREAEQEGGAAEAVTKTKHKTKAAITNLIQKTGKKMAGFRGDVSVDGAKKHVCNAPSHSQRLRSPSPRGDHAQLTLRLCPKRSVPRLIKSSLEET